MNKPASNMFVDEKTGKVYILKHATFTYLSRTLFPEVIVGFGYPTEHTLPMTKEIDYTNV